MIFWIDAQLSPALAAWIAEHFPIEAVALRELGLRDAEDEAIFYAARAAAAVVISKDADFPTLLYRLGPPPQILWITCGNTSNACLQSILAVTLPDALALLESGEPLVEISERAA